MPSVPLITGVVPVANVVHWFWPSTEYCSVYWRKSGVFAVPMIAVGIVTTGVTTGLVEAGGRGRQAVGRRQERERLGRVALVPLGVERLDDDREHAGRQPRRTSPCRTELIGDLVAVDQQDLARQRLAVVRLRSATENVTVSPTRAVVSERFSVTSGGSRFDGSVLSIRVKVFGKRVRCCPRRRSPSP